jgi:hypothetical protein
MLSVQYKSNGDEPFALGRTILQNVMGEKRGKTFEWLKYSNSKYAKNKSSCIESRDSIEQLVATVATILTTNGFNIDSIKYDLDFHRYNLFGKKHSTPFAWHEDDYGSTGYEVNTAVLYLRKDKTIRGGNLLVKGANKVMIEENTIVMMDGRLVHKPEDLEGFGCRDSIVVQFKRVKN